jgi:hypothetical protein
MLPDGTPIQSANRQSFGARRFRELGLFGVDFGRLGRYRMGSIECCGVGSGSEFFDLSQSPSDRHNRVDDPDARKPPDAEFAGAAHRRLPAALLVRDPSRLAQPFVETVHAQYVGFPR